VKLKRTVVILLAILSLAICAPAQKKGAAGKKAATKSEQKSGGLLDINSASEAQLKELPGIGDAYSTKIIAGRPYARKDELVRRKIVPQATYDKIKDRIIAKQGAKK